MGYSQLHGPSWTCSLGGVWLISFAIVLSSILLINLINKQHWWQPVSAAVLIALIWGLALSLQAKNWTTPAGEPLSVMAVQGNIDQNLKWDSAQIESQLLLYQSLTLNAAASDLIVWPETAVPILKDQAQGYLNSMERIISRQDSALITGLPVRQRALNGDLRYYNAMTLR